MTDDEQDLPGFEHEPETAESVRALAVMRQLAAELGLPSAEKGWMDAVHMRVNGIIFSARGERFTGHPSEFLRELRREEMQLLYRVRALERLKLGSWYCPACHAAGQPLDDAGMDFPRTMASPEAAP